MTMFDEDNAEVKLNVIENLLKIAKVLGNDVLTAPLLAKLNSLITHPNWRIREAVIVLVAELGILSGKEAF